MPARGQEGGQRFEKQGGFIAPDGGLSFAKRHKSIVDSPTNPDFDVLSYKLDLVLAMVDEGLAGNNLITLVLKTRADSLVLYQCKLTIDSVLVDGLPCVVVSDDAAERFTVHLGAVRQSGDTLRIGIAYRRLPGVVRPTQRLGYYYFDTASVQGLPANLGYTMSEPGDARCWMPCYDEPWDKASAQINVTVPSGYCAASNGRFLGALDNGDGTMTWRWREDHQIATYLMCATVSSFTVASSPFLRAVNDTIPVEYFAWARDSVSVAAFLPLVRQMITNLANIFGPYPWDKYAMALVNPFLYGGMEHQSMTTLHEAYGTSGDVVVHELAHQWWGDLVTCGSWPDVWLNEGFATYSEALWHESTGGPPALRSYMASMELLDRDVSWGGAVYNPVAQNFNLFDPVVYSKGAWVLHTLRGAIGDSAFFRSLRTWRQLYSEKSAVTAQFQGAVESAAGRDMSWFFNEWVYGPGWPVYAFAYNWQNGVLNARIVQQQSEAWPVYTMPLQIRAWMLGRDTTVIVWDSLRTQDFHIPLPFVPDSALFDPENRVLRQAGTPVQSPPEPGVPVTFTLEQNYPNPFNPVTTIGYRVPGIVGAWTASRVSLKVYDVLGKEVATLVDGSQTAGPYEVSFDGTRDASGVYIYRLHVQPGDGSPSITQVKKMTLVK